MSVIESTQETENGESGPFSSCLIKDSCAMTFIGQREEVLRFLQTTVAGGPNICVLEQWKTNSERFPNVTKAARAVLCV